MAVLKHIAIKNADYSAAVCYLKYQHDERHLKPLLDENGSMMLRSEFHMNGVNCNPDTFDLECEMLNDQVDLLSPAQHKITEAEYWLQKRGQKELEDINEQIIADGMNPMETTFQTRKQFVRNAVSEISSSAISFEDFQSQLFEKYKIHVKENRGRYSYLHPEREKYIFVIPQSDPEIFLPTPVCREPSASGQQQMLPLL